MLKKTEGRDVVLLVDGDPVAASTSCRLSFTVNTSDVTTKDSDGVFDESEATTIGWTVQNESFVAGVDVLELLINKWLSMERVQVNVEDANGSFSGDALISSLSVKAAVGEKATLSLSLEGASAVV